MLKKLRIRFIVINMFIVTVMLSAMFILLYSSVALNAKQDSLQMMRSMAMDPMRPGRPNGPRNDDVRLPCFCILINEAGEIMTVGSGFFDLSDETLVEEIFEKTEITEEKSGVLKDYNLRFLYGDGHPVKCIVYADMSNEQQMLLNLVRIIVFSGIVAFLVFLGISILLAHWTVKPVEKAWNQQKQFIANASHELKTPLTVIMTDAELINETGCPEDDVPRLSGDILSMSDQMKGLIEKMLDMARVEGISNSLKPSRVCLSEILSVAVMQFEPVFFEKGLIITDDIQSDLYISGFHDQLKQLADILLDNAQKYSTPPGNIKISLKKTSNKKCLITVSNLGNPISDDELKKLFDRFYRGSKVRSMNHSYGLGLSIAQSVCENHHGKIYAESKDGRNYFYVELQTAK